MTTIVINANTPEDVRDFLAKYFRDQASVRRRQASMARIRTDQRSHERLAESLELISRQLEQATIFPKV